MKALLTFPFQYLSWIAFTLLDKERCIIAKDLRGEQLIQTLDRLMKR